MENNSQMYKKGGVWKWIIIYLIAAVVIYGLIYYVIGMMKGGYSYTPQQEENNNTAPETTVSGSQDLSGMSNELDTVNLDQIDAGLNQNDTDAKSF